MKGDFLKMTQSGRDPVTLLQESGLRATPQRVAVLNSMDAMGQVHPTAEELYTVLKGAFPTISFATVYNTLRSLIDAGLAVELQYGDRASRFDLNTALHHHLICEKCGSMTDVYLPQLQVGDAGLEHDFQVTRYHVEIRGLCKYCREENRAGQGPN